MQTSSPPVITPNRSQSNPDDMITLPRPIRSVGMYLHNVSGTSTGQTLPRERRASPGTHFCPTIGWVYYRMPLVYLFLTSVFCYSCSFLFVVFCVFVFFFRSHWSLVDVPLIFFCPADHVPDWQPRVLLGMVEARSVNVKKTTTRTTHHLLLFLSSTH